MTQGSPVQMNLIKVTQGCSPVQMSLIKVTRGSPVQMGNAPPPQYDSWDRPPDIILVVMYTYMLLMVYVCGYVYCVYIFIFVYITTQTRVYCTPS